MFTAFPIIWFALFDQEYSKTELLSVSKHYQIGLRDQCFGRWIFWKWILYASVQALAITFITMYSLV